MSKLVARILLAIFMFPMAALLYLMIIVIFESSARYGYRSELFVFLTSDIATWAFVGGYWFLLWRSTVRWTSNRITMTIVSLFGTLLLGCLCGAVVGAIIGRGDGISFGVFVGGLVAVLSGLVATVFIWRESTRERAERIHRSTGGAVTCPTCGYNLTGLSESRCPECGSKYTLDELLAAQKSINVVDIE